MEMDLLERFARFIPVMLSLTVHEWAHAWSAWKLGDDTAKLQGRLTLNPLDHLDLVGTLLPILGIPFGWAKPVPINPLRFRKEIRMSTGLWITALAGPVSNILIAVSCGVVLFLIPNESLHSGQILGRTIVELLWNTLVINVILALFNLLPIPPLDGSRIVEAFLPNRLRPAWSQIVAISPILLVLVAVSPMLGFNVFGNVIDWIVSTIGPIVNMR